MANLDLKWLLILLISSVAVSGTTHYRRWCYYTNWSQYRMSPARFTPENIDPFLCTHISYAFATIVDGKAQHFEWNDESTAWSKGMYERAIAVKEKNPLLQIYVAIGGWNLGSEPFTKAVANADSRRRFIDSAIQLARRNKFDGIEIDWEYPGARGSPPSDKRKFTLLLQELRMAVEVEASTENKARLQLAAAVSAGKSKIDVAYEIPEISKYLDIINLMTYDFNGAWDVKTGHNSPLVPHGDEKGEFRFWNLESASIYWLQQGAPKEKLNIGVPTYGRTFKLADPRFTGIGAPAAGAGDAGLYTNTAGFLAYYEICHLLRNGAQEKWDDVQKVPYLVKDRLWVGYDNDRSLAEKVKWIMNMGFGGVMVWSLDLDDHASMCGGERYPLIHSIYRTLSGDSTIVTVPPQTTLPAQNNMCSGQNNVIYPKLDDCTKFIFCQNGQEKIFECTVGQTFDPIAKQCSTNTSPLCKTTTVPTVKTPRPSFIKTGGHDLTSLCKDRADGRYDNPNACDQYILCFGGRAFEATCSAGLFYDPIRNECLYKDLVPCIGPTLAPAVTVKQVSFCSGKSDGFFPDPADCRAYHICRSGTDFKQHCSPYQIFKDNKCIISEAVC